MIATLPMFPLELVAFPGEELPLHIFEQRYQQLIEDCEEERVTFGIPTYMNKQLEYGTEMELLKVVKRYPTGACDIICRGLRVFKLVDFYNRLDNKLYAGGIVQFFNTTEDGTETLRQQFIQLLTSFYKELEIPTPAINVQTINTYTLSHKIGLTVGQEYELLQISSERERYEYLLSLIHI